MPPVSATCASNRLHVHGCVADPFDFGQQWDNPKIGLKMRFSPVPCDDYSIWRAAKDAVGA